MTVSIIWGAGIYSALDNFKKTPEESIFKDIKPENVVEVPKWEGKERVNVLLLGGDARDAKDGDIARSDSIMVASLDPVTKKLICSPYFATHMRKFRIMVTAELTPPLRLAGLR